MGIVSPRRCAAMSLVMVAVGTLSVAAPSRAEIPEVAAGQRYSSTVTLSESRTGRPYVVKWREPGSAWTPTRRGVVGRDARVRVVRVLTERGIHRVKIRLPRHQGRPAHVTGVRQVRVTAPDNAAVTPDPVPTPGSSGAPETFTAYAVGDIGYPGGHASSTAGLIPDGGTVLVTGDLAYPSGTAAQLAEHYLPSYGRLLESTYPVPGNHDYATTRAEPYFDLFGSRVGTPDQPWFSWRRGAWTFYHLNSNCSAVGGCDVASPQYRWLSEQLASSPHRCVAALWHHPRWSASRHGNSTAVADLYSLLVDSGSDLLLTGHEHNYQRFDRLAADGSVSPTGVREFVTGAGGAPLYAVGTAAPSPQAWDDGHHGVLVMEFLTSGYAWRFVTTSGAVADSGSDTCD